MLSRRVVLLLICKSAHSDGIAHLSEHAFATYVTTQSVPPLRYKFSKMVHPG